MNCYDLVTTCYILSNLLGFGKSFFEKNLRPAKSLRKGAWLVFAVGPADMKFFFSRGRMDLDHVFFRELCIFYHVVDAAVCLAIIHRQQKIGTVDPKPVADGDAVA